MGEKRWIIQTDSRRKGPIAKETGICLRKRTPSGYGSTFGKKGSKFQILRCFGKKKELFNEFGEGPIFKNKNGLNEVKAEPRLSPDEILAAKKNLKNKMRGVGGPFGHSELSDLQEKSKRRREEM